MFKVSTKADSLTSVLEEMAKEQDSKTLTVGLDGHLFTKTAVESLKKAKGVHIVVNLEDKIAVEEATKTDKEEIGT